MNTLEKATQAQLNNIQKKTGKSMQDLAAIVHTSGLSRHGELRTMLMARLGLGFGDANALVSAILRTDGQRLAEGMDESQVLDGIYSGAKAPLRPIHEAVMREMRRCGDFEIVPKKGYVSLRRHKQFAMLGPAGRSRVELGLNVKDLPPSEHLFAQPRGSMCNYIVKLTDVSQVNSELVAWLHFAYENAA
jgi:hypothetical protein